MKIGIVLEGGASRTYFSCGVLDALLDEKIYADYFIGVSAGVAFGVSYCSRQKERNLQILRKYEATGKYMGFHHLFKPSNKSYYNLDFVFGEIPQKLVPFDFDVFDNRDYPCISVVTNVNTGKAEYIEMPVDKDFMALRASCALPLLFQPVAIGNEKYFDGGIADSIPVKKALDDGCDKVIVVLTRPRGYRKGKEKTTALVKLALRKYPKLLEAFLKRPDNYNKQIEELETLEKDGKAFVIAPEDTFGIGRLEKRVKVLEPFYRYGYDYAEKLMPQLKAYIDKAQV